MTTEQLWNMLSEKMTAVGLKLLSAAIVLIIGLLIIRLVKRWMQNSRGFKRIDQSARSFLGSLIRVVLYVLLCLTVAGTLGIPLTSFITILASASVAVGLALQGALTNFVGGLVILLTHPFRIGDYIEVSGQSGTVESIAVFYTTLCTYDNKQITLPNGSLTNTAIINYSSEKIRRVDLTFSVDYASDMEAVKTALLDEATRHELVLKDPAPTARLDVQNASSLDFVLRAWCRAEDYWTVYYDLMESVKTRFDRDGIAIPFPQMDVHLKN